MLKTKLLTLSTFFPTNFRLFEFSDFSRFSKREYDTTLPLTDLSGCQDVRMASKVLDFKPFKETLYYSSLHWRSTLI